MKHCLLIRALALPAVFLALAPAAHASFAAYSFSNLGPWVRLTATATSGFTGAWLNAIATDIYYNTLVTGGNPVCASGNCGYPQVCYNGTQCGGGTDGNGDFFGRIDREHPFGSDDSNFAAGFPGQFAGSEGGQLQTTAQHVCDVLEAADLAADGGGGSGMTLTAHATGSSDPGDDGGTRNTVLYTGTGWDVLESNHNYNGILGGNTARYAMTSLSCNSASKPVNTLTINGGSSATVKPGVTASLTWSDHDLFAAAKQTCTASVSPAGATAFVVPTPDALLPQPSQTSCDAAGGIFTENPKAVSDPGQTSTLMSVPRDSNGDPIYTYSCDRSSTPWLGGAGCTITYNDDSCKSGEGSGTCSKTVACDVTLPGNTIQVSSETPGTYTYDYSCTNVNGTTDAKATLIVSGAGITGSCSEDTHKITEGGTVTFTASASGGSGGYTYNWSGDDGLSGSTKKVTHTYASAGTYGNNQVKVTDGAGDKATFTCSPDITVSTVPPDLKAVDGVTYAAPVISGVSTTYTQSITNAGDTKTGTTFPVLFEYATDSDGANASELAVSGNPVTAGKLNVGASENVNLSFSTSTAGTFYIRACANIDTFGDDPPPSDGSGVQSETKINNNCGAWTKVKVQPFQVACTSNGTISSGDQGKWTATPTGGTAPFTYAWNYDGQGDCGDGSAGSSNTCKQTLYNPPTSTAVASVAVVDANGTEVDQDTSACAPVTISAGVCGAGFPSVAVLPARVADGTKVDISWSDTSTDAATCVLTKNGVDTGWEGNDDVKGCSVSGEYDNDTIDGQTKYCFSCAGDSSIGCATVNTTPGFQEY